MKATIKDEIGQVLQVISLDPKVFKTGSRGFYGNTGYFKVNGKKYKATCYLYEKGSKPKEDKK